MVLTKFILTVLIVISGFNTVSNYYISSLRDDIYLSDFKSDVFLDSFELLEKYGYPSERVPVTTEDGYVINMFHILRKGPPVILVHGVSDSSDEWLLLGPERSLAYQLADAGFDVWLYNGRGNRYSNENAMNIPKKEYWNFSYEDMGMQDMPAAIDHILRVTSQEKLSYIGFSQGTTIFLVMCSMRPEYNKKIEVSILLAPVAWIHHSQTPLIGILSETTEILTKLTESLDLYELFPYNPNKAFERINCHRRYPTALCNVEYHLNFGLVNSSYLSPDKITVIDSHTPAGVSAKSLIHFMQGYRSKRFQRFDYGMEKNLQIYSSRRPPLFNVKLITAPVNMFTSEIDWFSSYEDVKILKNKLPNIKRFIMFNKSLEMSHLEFVYGTRVKTLINDPVMDILLDDLNMR